MIKDYCITSCDKCRLAAKEFERTGIAHENVDMRKAGIDANVFAGWLEIYGLERLLNKRSTTWRQLDAAQQAKILSNPMLILDDNPAMLFRPIFDFGDHILVQKEALEWLKSQPSA